jgi:hypothetical protein
MGGSILCARRNLQKVPVDPLYLLKQITGSLPYQKIPVTSRHVNQASADENSHHYLHVH